MYYKNLYHNHTQWPSQVSGTSFFQRTVKRAISSSSGSKAEVTSTQCSEAGSVLLLLNGRVYTNSIKLVGTNIKNAERHQLQTFDSR